MKIKQLILLGALVGGFSANIVEATGGMSPRSSGLRPAVSTSCPGSPRGAKDSVVTCASSIKAVLESTFANWSKSKKISIAFLVLGVVATLGIYGGQALSLDNVETRKHELNEAITNFMKRFEVKSDAEKAAFLERVIEDYEYVYAKEDGAYGLGVAAKVVPLVFLIGGTIAWAVDQGVGLNSEQTAHVATHFGRTITPNADHSVVGLEVDRVLRGIHTKKVIRNPMDKSDTGAL